MKTETAALKIFDNYISGEFVAADDGNYFQSINPTTGEIWGQFADSHARDVDRAVRSAEAAFTGPWGELSPTRRGRLLMQWGDKIAEQAAVIAKMESEQNGKLFLEMHTQAKLVRDWLYYYGGLSDKIEGRVIPLDRTSVLNYTLREPLGVVAAIVPWNSPTFLTILAVAPALAAGNTVVIKPSEVTSASALELARLASEAGLPEGVVNVVTGNRQTGEALVDHPLVSKIAFTGSDMAGRAIAARAGGRLVPCTLELGGKSANIVFDDADVDLAETGLLAGIFGAAGQTCVAGSRAFVQRGLYEQLLGRLEDRARQIRLGDPLDPGTQMGPVATAAQLEKNRAMVDRARNDGATVICGGDRVALSQWPNGLFFSPTILAGASPASFIMQNEVFGPVLSILPFDDENEVVSIANATPFGLAAGVWTNDLRRAHTMARRLQAGTVWINTYRALTFNSPFGGYKNSGIGRQNGIEAVDAYLQTKSVWCELSRDIQDPFVIRS